jgi:hypothetical protein
MTEKNDNITVAEVERLIVIHKRAFYTKGAHVSALRILTTLKTWQDSAHDPAARRLIDRYLAWHMQKTEAGDS